MSIATPEGVDVDVMLAGLGSRFVAALIDQTIMWAVLLALLLGGTFVGAAFLAGPDGEVDDGFGLVVTAVFFLLVSLVQLGYPIVFEVKASGRTPGKRWTGLRVVRTGGGPVTFTASVVRNLLRLVDGLPFAYFVGVVAVLASSRNQRLGDMAAGTIVVRERSGGRAPKTPPWMRPEVRIEPSEAAMTWDVSGVSAEELVAVRRFLERRATLTPEARGRLAYELAVRLRPKIVGPDHDMHPEEFLLDLAAVKATRG